MVSTASMAIMGINLVLTIFLPFVLMIYFYKKEKINFSAVFTGALVFLVFQVLSRIPILNNLAAKQWFQEFSENTFLFVLFLAVTAGLFEEIGRFIAFKFPMRKTLSWGNGIAYGIGHGGFEAIYLVGIASINNLTYSFMINAGKLEEAFGEVLSPQDIAYVKSQLIETPSYMFLVGGIERVFTLFIQIALSLVVLYGVMNRKYIFLLYAILLHTLINFSALLQEISIWVAEGYIMILAVVSVVFIIKSKELFARINE